MIRLNRMHSAFNQYPLWVGLLLAAALTLGCDDPRPVSAPVSPAGGTVRSAARSPELVVVAVGDSLTEGLGVAEDAAYPAVLGKRLKAEGFRVRVVNSGVSGETSGGLRSRVNWVLQLEPVLVILVSGANDGLRGIDPRVLEENLDAVVTELQKAGVRVLLGSMRMVRNMGPEYNRAFEEVYPAVAARRGVVRVPFFLQDVAGRPDRNLEDGIHPNAAGYRQVVENLLPYVKNELERMGGKAAYR